MTRFITACMAVVMLVVPAFASASAKPKPKPHTIEWCVGKGKQKKCSTVVPAPPAQPADGGIKPPVEAEEPPADEQPPADDGGPSGPPSDDLPGSPDGV